MGRKLHDTQAIRTWTSEGREGGLSSGFCTFLGLRLRGLLFLVVLLAGLEDILFSPVVALKGKREEVTRRAGDTCHPVAQTGPPVGIEAVCRNL